MLSLNKELVKIFFEELFYICFILWLIFIVSEFIFPGLVVNFLNPHWVLIVALACVIIILIMKKKQ